MSLFFLYMCVCSDGSWQVGSTFLIEFEDVFKEHRIFSMQFLACSGAHTRDSSVSIIWIMELIQIRYDMMSETHRFKRISPAVELEFVLWIDNRESEQLNQRKASTSFLVSCWRCAMVSFVLMRLFHPRLPTFFFFAASGGGGGYLKRIY
jgi:hypothetical protein